MSNIKTLNGYSLVDAEAREQISQLSEEKVVKYSVQALTPEQKAQARENIGAAEIEEDVGLNYTSVVGDTLLIGDCDGGSLKGLSIYGATFQNPDRSVSNPKPLQHWGMSGEMTLNISNKNLINLPFFWGSAPKTVGGVTYTPNDDGSISVKGTVTGYGDYRIQNIDGFIMPFSGQKQPIKDGSYYEQFLDLSVTDCTLQHFHTNNAFISYIPGTSSVLTIGDVVDKTYYPQIEFGKKQTKFVSPVNAQKITISTPNGLKGIPVKNGGTYTDSEGVSWICDEIDLGKGVFIQRIGQIDSYSGEAVGEDFLSTTGELTTGATVLYVLDIPVRTTLPDSVINAFSSLKTHRNGTSVYIAQLFKDTPFETEEHKKIGVTMMVKYRAVIDDTLDEEKVSDIAKDATAFDGTRYGLPVLALTGKIDGMTKDNAVTLSYAYGGKTGTCSVKWQGSSSISWEKKNYTIKFDNAFEAVEGWGAQKKYCLKANFIDHSHARNVVNAKLWGQIVRSRDSANERLLALPNCGAVDGFPCVITLNGKFHGLYTFNIPKDGWMFGMSDSTLQQAILCADSQNDACGFKALATLTNDFDLEYVSDEDNADWVLTSLNRLISAVMNSNGSDLDTTVAQYLDWDSAIDYLAFCSLLGGTDMYRKNYLLVTYDGVKWFFSAYDMDTTYGLKWTGRGFNGSKDYPHVNEFNHRVMELIMSHKANEFKARYKKLRETVMSEENLYLEFSNWASKLPTPVMVEDVKKWASIPSSASSNTAQILNWYRLRVGVEDARVDKM